MADSIPRRVVSLKPNLTSILMELGLGESIVGVTKYCPQPHNKTPIVADYNSIDLESVLRLKPDLIVSSYENSQQKEYEILRKAGIPLLLVEASSFQGMLDSIRKIAAHFAILPRAETLIVGMQKKLSDLKTQVLWSCESPRFVAIVQKSPVMVAGGLTYISSLLEQVGFHNIYTDEKIPYPVVNEEEVLKERADYYFFIDHELTGDVDFHGQKMVRLATADFLAAPKSVTALEAVLANLPPLQEQTQTGDRGDLDDFIFFQLSLPRFIMAFLVGAALSVAGVAFQSLLRNPLADPYILGVSGGAALGYVLAIVLGLPLFFVPIAGYVAALISLGLIYQLASTRGVLSVMSLLLTGVVFNAFSFSLILVINALANFGQAHQILYLMLGSVEAVSWDRIILFAGFFLVSFVILWTRSRALNLLALGDEEAFHLGVNVRREKIIVFVLTSLLVGASVSLCGLIGFVGLFVPHLVRLCWGADNRVVLPVSALVGGVFLVMSDFLAAHVISFQALHTKLPVGAVTALIGAPLFVFLLKRQMVGQK